MQCRLVCVFYYLYGFSTNVEGTSRPFIWKDGVMTDLGTLGGSFGGAKGIAANGNTIGNSANVQGQSKPTLWFHNSITELGLPFQNTSLEHIANSGFITGTHYPFGSAQPRAFLWFNNEVTTLGTLGGNYSFGYSVNDNGYVVGRSRNEDGEGHAFLWMP